MKSWIALASLVLPGLAGATGERIVVLAPSGATGIRAQLVETLCVSEDCVAPEKVLSAGKLDWNKVNREHVVAVVAGHAQPTKKGPTVALEVLSPGGKAKMSEKSPLDDANKLSVKDLVTASAQALAAIDSDAPAKEPGTKASGKALAQRGHAKSVKRLAARPHAGHARG
jgi:hypothetical protein